jgi:hypothetical protein
MQNFSYGTCFNVEVGQNVCGLLKNLNAEQAYFQHLVYK